MVQAVDGHAAAQLEALFHTDACIVWELCDPEPSVPDESVVIRDQAGAAIACARPAS
jgi:hypothetical protein